MTFHRLSLEYCSEPSFRLFGMLRPDFKNLSEADESVVRTGIKMPQMNSVVEADIGHAQKSCFNHFVCFSLNQLDYIRSAYLRYYNEQRPHQSLVIGNRILDPSWQPPPPIGTVKRKKIRGGLLNNYYWAAD